MQDQVTADAPGVTQEPTDEQLREVMAMARRQHPTASVNDSRGGSNEAGAERDWPCARCRGRRVELERKIERIERGTTGNVFVGQKNSDVEREMALVSFRAKLRELPADGVVRQTFIGAPLKIWGPLCCARCNAELEAEAVADNQRRDDEERAFEAKKRERRLIASVVSHAVVDL